MRASYTIPVPYMSPEADEPVGSSTMEKVLNLIVNPVAAVRAVGAAVDKLWFSGTTSATSGVTTTTHWESKPSVGEA